MISAVPASSCLTGAVVLLAGLLAGCGPRAVTSTPPPPPPPTVRTSAAAAVSADQQFVHWVLTHVYHSTDDPGQIAGEGHWICQMLAAHSDPRRDRMVEQASEHYLCPSVTWLP